MNIGIFGGTFNPIHYGHLRAAEEISQNFLEKVVFVPTNITSNKESVSQYPDKRLQMIKIAAKNNKRFAVSDIEIKRGGVSYSYDTILSFKDLYPRDDLYFIIGTDAYLNISSWKNSEEVFDMVNFIVANRGHAIFKGKSMIKFVNCLPDNIQRRVDIDYENNKITIAGKNSIYLCKITRMDVSSTIIRNNFKKNISNLYLLPKDVIDYIMDNRIYF